MVIPFKKYGTWFAKYGGVISVLSEWFALFFFYLQFPEAFTGEHTISYFATLSQTKVVFILCYLLAAVSFWAFAIHHLKKHYRTPVTFFAISMICFGGMALYPFTFEDSLRYGIHLTLAHTSFVTFLAGVYLLGRRNDDKLLHKVSVITVVMTGTLLLLFVTVPKHSQYIMPLETGAWLVIQLWLLWISFYVAKRKPLAV